MTNKEMRRELGGIRSDVYGMRPKPAIAERITQLMVALASEPEPLAEDAGPLWFDHLGFPHLRGQHITVPLLGKWVAGLDGGTQLSITITERPNA